MAGRTAVVSDARMLAHDPGRSHPERADRLRVLLDHLEDAPGLVRLHPRLATEDELALVHTRAHIERVARTAGRPRVVFDPDTSASADSYEAARLAAGSLLVGCEATLAVRVANAVALVRPPRRPPVRARATGFSPEFVLVSAGFDCDHRDPLGAMAVTPAGFTAMAQACTQLAGESAGGRIAAALEGGYDLRALVEGVDAVLAAMRGTGGSAPPV